MKVLLVNPPITAIHGHIPPLGLMCIASNLEKNGIDVEIFNRKEIKSYEDYKSVLLEHINLTHPDLIGFTCYLGDVSDIKELCVGIKKIKDIPIVVGGFHPSYAPQEFLGYADYVCIGEGEITVLELAKSIENNTPITDVQGISVLKHSVKYTEPRPLADLDTLPPPAYHLIDMSYYTRLTDGILRGVLVSCGTLYTSRGCPYHCTFCPKQHFLGPQRLINAKKAVDEMEILIKKYKVNAIYFLDETFTINKQHVYEICDEIDKRGIKIIWGCDTRANLLSEDLLLRMKKSGCIQVDFGLESGVERVLKILKKGVSLQQAKDTLEMCRKNGVRTLANYMTNIPTETVQEREETIRFAKEINADRLIYNIFVPFPGCEIVEKYNISVTEKDYPYLNTLKQNATLKYVTENYNFTPDHKDLDELAREAIFRIGHRRLYPFIMNWIYVKNIVIGNRKIEYLKWTINKGLNVIKIK
ncbi:MAG: radical SAM protein [Candidatus Methanoperedens sp.]|nr:radical SAM protein [Candidatus Methanoperedens sp.]MCZ7371208.1 radical SAM protein [Candidatus Methanoperedens sp.]